MNKINATRECICTYTLHYPLTYSLHLAHTPTHPLVPNPRQTLTPPSWWRASCAGRMPGHQQTLNPNHAHPEQCCLPLPPQSLQYKPPWPCRLTWSINYRFNIPARRIAKQSVPVPGAVQEHSSTRCACDNSRPGPAQILVRALQASQPALPANFPQHRLASAHHASRITPQQCPFVAASSPSSLPTAAARRSLSRSCRRAPIPSMSGWWAARAKAHMLPRVSPGCKQSRYKVHLLTPVPVRYRNLAELQHKFKGTDDEWATILSHFLLMKQPASQHAHLLQGVRMVYTLKSGTLAISFRQDVQTIKVG